MSPENWSKGPGSLSLGGRRLGDVGALPPTAPRFGVTRRARVSGGQCRQRFSPALERPLRSALARRETSGTPAPATCPCNDS